MSDQQVFDLLSELMFLLEEAERRLPTKYQVSLNRIARACNELEKKAGGRRKYPSQEVTNDGPAGKVLQTHSEASSVDEKGTNSGDASDESVWF